jgi:aminopeptidase
VDAEELTRRLAELAIAFGANVQPGQIVFVQGEPDHAPLVRALAGEAYRCGARFVDAFYFDPHVKRARIEHAPDGTLDFVPPWYSERMLALGEQRCARVWVTGHSAPGLFDDLDPARAGSDLMPRLKETGKIVNDRTTNWTIIPYPTEGWARQVHPDLDGGALAKLTDELAHILRLDEEDPVAAWWKRFDVTTAAAERLTERRFDALRFRGPGTDLTIGLFASSRWRSATFETVDGIPHKPNLPSEEVFTSPDPARTEGHVTATKPLVFSDGSVVRGLRVRFEGGRAVSIDADEGADNLRTRIGSDAGGAALGEVALVDREGRIGPLGTVFYDTLLDENAASHIALGSGFAFAVDDDADRARVNESGVHFDFMIGGDDVDVTGITRDGEEVPVLEGGAWRI